MIDGGDTWSMGETMPTPIAIRSPVSLHPWRLPSMASCESNKRQCFFSSLDRKLASQDNWFFRETSRLCMTRDWEYSLTQLRKQRPMNPIYLRWLFGYSEVIKIGLGLVMRTLLTGEGRLVEHAVTMLMWIFFQPARWYCTPLRVSQVRSFQVDIWVACDLPGHSFP